MVYYQVRFTSVRIHWPKHVLIDRLFKQAGIGTYTTPQIATPIMAKISKTLDTMIAWNMDAHVMSEYAVRVDRLRLAHVASQAGTSFSCRTVSFKTLLMHRMEC